MRLVSLRGANTIIPKFSKQYAMNFLPQGQEDDISKRELKLNVHRIEFLAFVKIIHISIDVRADRLQLNWVLQKAGKAWRYSHLGTRSCKNSPQ